MTEIDENRFILESLGVIDPETPKTEPSAERDEQNESPQSDQEIIGLLTAIKQRIAALEGVYATTLSGEISNEIDAWRSKFKDLADVLIDRDPESLYEIVRGREDFFLSLEKVTAKPQIPVSVQRMAELAWEVSQQPAPEPPKSNAIDFGLGTFLS
jgi:hypothetical protein